MLMPLVVGLFVWVRVLCAVEVDSPFPFTSRCSPEELARLAAMDVGDRRPIPLERRIRE